MKPLCQILIVLFFANASSAFAQILSDSITVYVDQRVELKVIVPDYHKLKTSTAEVTELEKFLSALPKLFPSLNSEKPDSVVYNVGGEMLIKPGDETVIYKEVNGEFVATGIRDKALLIGEGFKIIITAADLSKIASLPIKSCMLEMIKKLPAKNHRSKSLFYDCTNKEITELTDLTKTNFPLEQLEINFGAGFGLYRNNWASDFSVGIHFNVFKKKKLRSPYLSYNFIFDFDESGKPLTNTFMNIGYGWNTDKSGREKNSLYVEAGYLMSRKGELFEEDTFRFGLKWSVKRAVWVSPHVYASGSFENVYTGVRVGFSF